jgi:hypothetical protein
LNKSFYIFNQSSSVENRIQQLEQKVNNMQLMYRKPGSEEYQNITMVLDEIFKKSENHEGRISILEDLHFDCGK